MKNKTIFKRIGAFLCAMICVLGMVAQPLTVCAAVAEPNVYLPISLCRMYSYYSLGLWNKDTWVLCVSNEPLEWLTTVTFGGEHIFKVYQSKDGMDWSQTASYDTIAGGVFKTSGKSYKEYKLNEPTTAVGALGYLKDITLKTERIPDDILYRVSFGEKTTGNYEIPYEDCVVRVWGELTYYDSTTKMKAYTTEQRVVVGDYGFTSDYFIDVNLQDVYDAVGAVTPPLDLSVVTEMGYIRSDTLYFQLFNTKTLAYGGYVRLDNKSYNVGGSDNLTTITPDGDVDEDGYVGAGTDGNQSTGNAGSSIGGITIPSIDLSGFSSFSDALDDVSSSLGSVSSAFGSVFGFLPPWCLSLFGLSVGAMILVAMIKFIRG